MCGVCVYIYLSIYIDITYIICTVTHSCNSSRVNIRKDLSVHH